MKKIPVLIDVDSGVDDALAILLASSSSRLRILGISAVNGSADVDKTYRNTCYIANRLGLSVPITAGFDRPILKTDSTNAQVPGEQELGLMSDISDHPVSKPVDLFQLYDELISGSNKPVTILTLGPLTNIGAVISCLPHLKSNIANICIMGGAIEQGNVTAAAEYNIWQDPEAAAMVIHSGVPVTFAPLDVTNQATISEEEIQLISSGASSKAQIFVQMLDSHLNTNIQNTDVPGVLLHDLVPVMWVIYPESFTSEMSFVTVDTGNSETRGATLIDHYDTLKRKPNARILKTINRDKMIFCIHESFKFLGQEER